MFAWYVKPVYRTTSWYFLETVFVLYKSFLSKTCRNFMIFFFTVLPQTKLVTFSCMFCSDSYYHGHTISSSLVHPLYHHQISEVSKNCCLCCTLQSFGAKGETLMSQLLFICVSIFFYLMNTSQKVANQNISMEVYQINAVQTNNLASNAPTTSILIVFTTIRNQRYVCSVF